MQLARKCDWLVNESGTELARRAGAWSDQEVHYEEEQTMSSKEDDRGMSIKYYSSLP